MERNGTYFAFISMSLAGRKLRGTAASICASMVTYTHLWPASGIRPQRNTTRKAAERGLCRCFRSTGGTRYVAMCLQSVLSIAYVAYTDTLRIVLLCLFLAAVRRTVTFMLPDEDSAGSSEPTYECCENVASLVGAIHAPIDVRNTGASLSIVRHDYIHAHWHSCRQDMSYLYSI